MKASLKWLSDHVTLPDAKELAQQLTFAGLEIEGMEQLGQDLGGVVVAQVVERVQHPNADKLSVTRVDAGPHGTLQVVCGAKNFQVGDKVPLAMVGAKLPNGMEISRAQLRGVDSHGMLCSAKELGLSEDSAGLMILEPGLPVGQPLAAALGLEDSVFEVNVTPNRPDALSHVGIAREIAVLTQQALRLAPANLKEGSTPASSRIQVRVEAPARCPHYAVRVIEGVTIGPSPSWLANRLRACGVRSINNIVDVTNFVLLESGQPLHGFDLDRLAGPEIVVRTARSGERLTTLDGKERLLDEEDLLVCDRDAPQAIAGVMGGGHSEVTASTRNVLLESAFFQPSSVRRSAKRHGLHTEASHRFERGIDAGGVGRALDRAAALMAELGRGTVLHGTVVVAAAPLPAREVLLPHDKVSRLLGMAVPREETRRILLALGFTALEEGPDATRWRVPSWRVDVERPEDLVEEVARIRGYDLVPVELPRGGAELLPEPGAREAERRIHMVLGGAGFDEVVNYSFVSKREQEALGEAHEAIALVNPLSAEQGVMRTSLLPGLLRNASQALRHQVTGVRLYELGRVYLGDPGGGGERRPVAKEKLVLAGALLGERDPRSWTTKVVPADFFDLKGAVESLLAGLNVRGARFEAAEHPMFHPRASATVRSGSGRFLGRLGELHPRAAKKLAVETPSHLFELDVEALVAEAALVPVFEELSRFPAVLRDLAVVVPVEMRSEEVRQVILEVGGALVEGAHLFDVYVGKPLPEGKKNLAYALRYRSRERTLKDEEVALAHAQIVEQVNARLGAHLRS